MHANMMQAPRRGDVMETTHVITAGTRLALRGAFAALVAGMLLMQSTGMRGQGAARDWTKDMQMKITEPFTIAAVGDLIIDRPASQLNDPGLQAALKIIKDTDLGVGNFESNIRD